MSDYIMKVIPEPRAGTASILAPTKKKPVFKGIGDDNYLCGKCKFVICKSIVYGQIINLVFKCPNCGNYSLV